MKESQVKMVLYKTHSIPWLKYQWKENKKNPDLNSPVNVKYTVYIFIYKKNSARVINLHIPNAETQLFTRFEPISTNCTFVEGKGERRVFHIYFFRPCLLGIFRLKWFNLNITLTSPSSVLIKKNEYKMFVQSEENGRIRYEVCRNHRFETVE